MKSGSALLLCSALALTATGQQLQLNLEHLESKASNSVDVSLNHSMLQLAAKFLDNKDPDEALVKKFINGLDGIYVKDFEFKTAGSWSPSDLEGVHTQLKNPQWGRIVGVKSTEDGEVAEVYVRTEGEKVTGVAIICTSPKELTVVNIVGPVDLDSLAEIGGHFNIPKLQSIPRDKPKNQPPSKNKK